MNKFKIIVLLLLLLSFHSCKAQSSNLSEINKNIFLELDWVIDKAKEYDDGFYTIFCITEIKYDHKTYIGISTQSWQVEDYYDNEDFKYELNYQAGLDFKEISYLTCYMEYREYPLFFYDIDICSEKINNVPKRFDNPPVLEDDQEKLYYEFVYLVIGNKLKVVSLNGEKEKW